MLIVDTHALVWSRSLDAQLGMRAWEAIEQAWQSGSIAVSAFTFWEMAMLLSKGRSGFPEDVSLWRQGLLGQGLIEVPVDGAIGIRATALAGHRLATADTRILAWSSNLDRLDSRT